MHSLSTETLPLNSNPIICLFNNRVSVDLGLRDEAMSHYVVMLAPKFVRKQEDCDYTA